MQDTAPDGTEMTGGWYDAGGNANLQPADFECECAINSHICYVCRYSSFALPAYAYAEAWCILYIVDAFMSIQLLMLLQIS